MINEYTDLFIRLGEVASKSIKLNHEALGGDPRVRELYDKFIEISKEIGKMYQVTLDTESK
jgi:hypothetical protein